MKRYLLPHVDSDQFATILLALFKQGEKELGIAMATGAAEIALEDEDPNATISIPILNPSQERLQRHTDRTRGL